MYELLYNCEGFEWDEGNSKKNWIRHQVTRNECEQVFFNKSLIVAGYTMSFAYGFGYYVKNL